MNSVLMQDPLWKGLITQSSVSTKMFASTFMGERFTRPFSSLTDQIFKLIDDPQAQKVVIAAPRGWGKTSINTIALPAKLACYRQANFVVPVSATADKAMLEASNLRMEFEHNHLLKHVFGDMKTSEWTQDQFILGDTFVKPRGAGQQVRGLNYQGKRPDWIIVDDLETTEGVMSETQREKLKHWFFSDLLNCVDRGSDKWKIIVIGTVLHEGALLVELLKDPTWKSVTISLCDDNLRSNWPDFMSDKKILELYESFRERGQADTFAREYQSKPISTLDAAFKPSMFRYFDPGGMDEAGASYLKALKERRLHFVTIVDPAKTLNLKSADSAVITLAIDLEGYRVYVVDVSADKMHPDELYDCMFDQIQFHGSMYLGVEVTSLNEFIVQPIKNEMAKRSIHPILIELNPRASKEQRVSSLIPFYRQGYIYHNKAVTAKLEAQLLSFPRSELWDVMDALAYVVQMMEKQERYFFGEDLPNNSEYQVLEDMKEDELNEQWRIA